MQYSIIAFALNRAQFESSFFRMGSENDRTSKSERTHEKMPETSLAGMFGRREEFYRTILESLAQGLLITDAESRILYVNRAMEEMTGCTRDEMISQLSYELLAPRSRWPQMRRRLQERLRGKTENYQNELVRKDGSTVWISVSAAPYRNTHNEIVGTVGTIMRIDREKSLELENARLRDELERDRPRTQIIGSSPAFQKVVDQVRMVAPTCSNVLVLGESGTGKELIASAIHEQSDRRNKPFVRVNCASVPKDLFESEFFGHVRGAFTGAIKDRVGRFELARDGSLFLDEVGEIPLDLQAKLLRVIQEGQFERIGEDRTRSVNVRLICATNRDLEAEAKAGRFREDLYYRLSVFPIELPPLRDRPEDIPVLAEHFLRQSAERIGMPEPRPTREQLKELESYEWPGNVRELQNVVERAVILARHDGRLEFALGHSNRRKERSPRFQKTSFALGQPDSIKSLKATERNLIEEALVQTNGKIYGSDGAAALLGLKPTTLASRISRQRIKKPV
jgi:PAS domain S-box-containing protein